MKHCASLRDGSTLECGCSTGGAVAWLKVSTVLSSCTVAATRSELSKVLADMMDVERRMLELESEEA